ncbi:MAG: response regulator [Chthoniobacter sp.]|uniref:response regulator n=1 Tax=Chthoniobacter sp. TaxID=2510640 RepID=UPI0032ADCE85
MSFIPPSSTSQQLVVSSSVGAVAERTPTASAPEYPPHKDTILIVDDDDALRTTAAMMLECQGFKTVTAGNRLEALQQLERNPQISAVLLDLLMPVMDGEETFRQLRNFWAGIPVILISGFDLSEIRKNFGAPPPEGFVQKPFTFAKLTGALDRVLG